MSKARNISTEHQEKGSARSPSDTLDRPAKEDKPARDWQPGRDEGRIKPADQDEGGEG
ncbi:hypothetical protein FHS96_002527 [Sphingomonas zeicaulis]|uniref:hypothetical protein n=1 Tax=Sphingomonas zeicaulis TaxID=1632740 RepID=UPI003D1B1D71